MKGKVLIFSGLITHLTLFACTNSAIEVESDKLVYESRCGAHEFTYDERLKSSAHQKLLYTSPPRYPISAVRQGIEGYVKLEFDISPEGKPINIAVIEAYPSSVFNTEAIRAISGWHFESLPSECRLVQLDFKLG